MPLQNIGSPEKSKRIVKRILMLIILAGILAFLSWHYKAYLQAFTFRNKLDEYASIDYPPVRGTPYRTGKMLVVDRPIKSSARRLRVSESRRINRDWYTLPPEMRAGNPGEVDTLVLCSIKRVKQYLASMDKPGSTEVLQIVIDIDIFDMDRKLCVGRATIEGEIPEEGSYEALMSEPIQPDISEYLIDLPEY